MWNLHCSQCNSCSAHSHNILGCNQDSWMIFPAGSTVHTIPAFCKSMQAGKCTLLFQLIRQWSLDAEWRQIQYLICGALKVSKLLLVLACFNNNNKKNTLIYINMSLLHCSGQLLLLSSVVLIYRLNLQ